MNYLDCIPHRFIKVPNICLSWLEARFGNIPNLLIAIGVASLSTAILVNMTPSNKGKIIFGIKKGNIVGWGVTIGFVSFIANIVLVFIGIITDFFH